MPIGVLVNIICVILGGIVGSLAGHKLTDAFKEGLNSVFGVCAMAIGISSIVLMTNMPAVIFAVIAGTAIGLFLHLGERINRLGVMMMHVMEKILRQDEGTADESRRNLLVTTIVLFCCSGTGIYGAMVSGMTGDHSILLAKSVLDFPTAMIFACSLGLVVALVAIPQLAVFLVLFYLAKLIYPLCSPEMINDFKACCGILLLATGFRIAKIKNFPIADMIPAMILVMPVSHFWTSCIIPLLG